MIARFLYAATSFDAINVGWIDGYAADVILTAQPGLSHAAYALCSAQSGGSSGGGGRGRSVSKARKTPSRKALAEQRAAKVLQRQASLKGEQLARLQQRRQVAATIRPRSKLYEQYTEQQKRRAERINAPQQQRRDHVSRLDRLKQKLARQYPNAKEVYNNSFNRLNYHFPVMIKFLDSLPRDVIAEVIKFDRNDKAKYRSEGNAFYQKLAEAGYEPPLMVAANPLWYHEDASNYGI
jgi:hypothetical protein